MLSERSRDQYIHLIEFPDGIAELLLDIADAGSSQVNPS